MSQGAYGELVAQRKACHRCSGLINPSTRPDLDSDQIGPWSRWQGNLEAEVLVVGQDWGDTRYYEKNKGRDRADNPTNETLRKLMEVAGLHIDLPGPDTSGLGVAFFTNAILCLKEGGMQAAVNPVWFENCGRLFLRPTIELVKPKIVITLGERAYRAVCGAYGLRARGFRAAVEGEPEQLSDSGPLLLPVYHCGARILNTHRPFERQKQDWIRAGRVLAARRPK